MSTAPLQSPRFATALAVEIHTLRRSLALLRAAIAPGCPVLIHVMHPDEPRALEILDQARRAAPAVDSRFLRVWDAVLVEDEAHGSYIVCEYAPGQSLELALRQP